MKSRRTQLPPIRRGSPGDSKNLRVLDRFSQDELNVWKNRARDYDELYSILYAGLEPQRQRYYEEIIGALQSVQPINFPVQDWTRIVTHKYTLNPLSAAGSLTSIGGRFNVGLDVINSARAPSPALYIANDYPTAHAEYFQTTSNPTTGSLSPEDFALASKRSFSSVRIHGHISKLFDLTTMDSLVGLIPIFKKMRLPKEVKDLERKLKIRKNTFKIISSASDFYNAIYKENWRFTPTQFGIPSATHQISHMIKDAGFEGIKYKSTKGSGECIALFPDSIASDQTYLELSDEYPEGTQFKRLDITTARELCGWYLLHPSQRPENM